MYGDGVADSKSLIKNLTPRVNPEGIFWYDRECFRPETQGSALPPLTGDRELAHLWACLLLTRLCKATRRFVSEGTHPPTRRTKCAMHD